MWTRTKASLALASVASLVLVGCSATDGGDNDPPSTAATGGDGSGEAVELTFWHGYTEGDGDVLQGIVDSFNESQDGIRVTTEVNPWAVIDDTLLPALSAGDGPDIVAMPAERLPVYADRGAFVALDDWFGTPESNTASINPGAAEMVTVDGSIYGVPTGFVPLALYYNQELFDEAGIAEPPADWDEWVEVAKELTVDENGDGTPEQYGVVLPDHATVANGLWPSLFYGNGGGIQEGAAEAVIDSPENLATLQFWQDAIVDDKISPQGVDGIGADEVFSSGRAAMTVGGPWMVFIAADNDIDYGIAPIPAGPEEQAASAIGVSMAVTDQGDDAKTAAAQEFFAYFFNDENSVEWALGSGWPPLRTDIPADAVSENPTVVALTEQAELARPLLPGVVNSVEVLAAIDELTQKAMAGGDIEALLAEAEATIQSNLG